MDAGSKNRFRHYLLNDLFKAFELNEKNTIEPGFKKCKKLYPLTIDSVRRLPRGENSKVAKKKKEKPKSKKATAMMV